MTGPPVSGTVRVPAVLVAEISGRTSVTVMVTGAEDERKPVSVTWMVREKEGLVPKSRRVLSAIVI